MALFSHYSMGPYVASSLAKWFHSAPHEDLDFSETTTIFSPGDKLYREALFVIALCIACVGAVKLILMVLYYTCCFCISRTRKRKKQKDFCCCKKRALQVEIFILALICSAAIVIGFTFNGKTSDGVHQFRKSVNDLRSDISIAANKGNKMVSTLSETIDYINELKSYPYHYPAAEKAFIDCTTLHKNLLSVDQLLPMTVVNESCTVGKKFHHFDNFRWLTTVVLLSWSILLCIFLFWLSCHVNGCIIFLASIFCLMSVLFFWSATGVNVGIATGIGDFCVHPKESVETISGANQLVVSYYMDCNNSTNPFEGNLSDVRYILQHVIYLIGNIPDSSLHVKKYMNAMEGICEKSLNSLGILTICLVVLAFVSGLLTCCTCSMWDHRKDRPVMFSDKEDSPESVKEAALWWPRDVDYESDEIYDEPQREDTQNNERTPLMISSVYRSVHEQETPTHPQNNVNAIHVNYHGHGGAPSYNCNVEGSSSF
ncbi:protein tweety homolog 2-like isoform X2 [Xenia sp. Carnegie-2017]|uniref:protein tweety homolog 2-like isoform X2 n=1 Tax=Xenia sp. Carnegie-2017 TaxID=2897299 RepID=UPI001F044F52|nr:protein tweety homolog 2-like isoform X2 [Xenia sp. Carnegie-2017]